MSSNKRTVRTLSHCFYDLKYHLVWTPKYRGKVLGHEKVKSELRRIFSTIAKWKHWELIELNVQEDHIHMVLLATPRDSISYVMQVMKGKSSAWLKKKINRTHGLYEKQSLWARGYFVSTIGLDEHLIRRYVTHQQHHNQTDQPFCSTSYSLNNHSRSADIVGKPKATGHMAGGWLPSYNPISLWVFCYPGITAPYFVRPT